MLKVYHFDINGTIIGTDSTDNVSIEEMASEALSRSISLDGEISGEELTYYLHIKQTTKDYKSKIYNCVDEFPQHKDRYNQLVKVFKQGLFESFLKLVDREFKNNKSLLVLRTFGKDRDFVASMLKDRNMTFVSYKSGELNDKLYRDCHEKGVHIMVQDDYKRWNDNGRAVEFGKEIKHFEGIIQYGFDDNPCMNCESGVGFYRVNTLRAALEEDYYIKMLE